MIFSWNVRGLNDRNKQREVSRWITANRIFFGGLLETRVRETNIIKVIRSTLPGWSFDANYSEEAGNGRIVVVWNPVLAVVTYFKSDQLMLCGVFNPLSNTTYSVAFVYARHTDLDREPLWDSLRNLASSSLLIQSPWLVLGDFNQVMRLDEMYSLFPYQASLQGIHDFQSCLDTSRLSDLDFRGCLFTWTNRQPTNPIARKLDRALSNEVWLDSFPHTSVLFDAPGPSDHSPCLVTLDHDQIGRKTPFRFFPFFASHPDYTPLLTDAWNDVDSEPGLVLLCKRLRQAKLCCKSLNRSSFANIPLRSKEAFDNLHAKQQQLHVHPSQLLFEEEKEARDVWKYWSAIEESFYCKKSRIRWLGEGDANTAFFHKSVKTNLSKNVIHHLRNSEGERVSNPNLLKNMVEQFYQQLLGVSNSAVSSLSVNQIRDLHPFRCSASLSTSLLVIPSPEEIAATVFAMPRNKAPGPDGFTMEFFISSWPLVGPDLISGVQEFFTSSRMLRQINATAISLIPKTTGAEYLSDFRPISCCNTVYKVISRILASRLKLFLDDAVQGNQVGFIPGRLLCENVLLASELVSDFHKPGPTTRGCLQIDLTKAYDKLEWGFIVNILKAFDLPEKFIGWIRSCITTTSFSVSLNGELVGFFPGKRGLRQGDPISSSLFAFAMDVLSRKLDHAVQDQLFSPHPQCLSPLVTHLSFADDVLIFFDGSQYSLGGIMDILSEFFLTSGLDVNLAKTKLFLDGNNALSAHDMAATFGIIQGDLPVRYLGLPLLPHKMRPQDYQPLIDRVSSRVSSWVARHLSFAGRLQLIQSVLYGIMNFWASVFPLPKACLSALEKICNAYLWNGAPNSARGAKISWDSVCTPKEAGGLGLRRLEDWHKVFGLKLIWLIFTKSGSLWVSWVKENLIRGRLFWDHPVQNSGSWLWRRMLKLRPLARPFLIAQVGSGTSALFWHDNWSGLGPLIDITGANGPRVTGLPRMATVSQSISNGVWRLPRGRHPITLLLRSKLPLTPPALQIEVSDYFLWHPATSSAPGPFSSSTTWLELHPTGSSVSWYNSVWFPQRVPKHAFISWILMRDRILTRDRLLSWGLQVPAGCVLCNAHPETRAHLFFDCQYATEVLLASFNHDSLLPPTELHAIVSWVKNASSLPKVNVICKLLLQATIYELWRERNLRIHGSLVRHQALIIKEIQILMRCRLASLDRPRILLLPHRNTSIASSTGLTYLSTWFGFFQTTSVIGHHWQPTTA